MIREFTDRFGWKKITDDEYILEVEKAFTVRTSFKEDTSSLVETVIHLPQELNGLDIVKILSEAGEDYVDMFKAKIEHEKKNSECSLVLSFKGGFDYPFEKLNTYFLAGLYEQVQKNNKLGVLLLGHYKENCPILLSGNYYDDFPTIVKLNSDTVVHPLSMVQDSSVTLHDKAGYYNAQSNLFGETRDNVFLPLLSYFLQDQLILLVPEFKKKIKKNISLFTGVKVMHMSTLQRHVRELIRAVKKEVKNKTIEPHILKWHERDIENLALDEINFIRYYWAFRDFINYLPNASKTDLNNYIKNKILKITPLMENIDACVSYSNCSVDHYIKRKACYEGTKDFEKRKLLK